MSTLVGAGPLAGMVVPTRRDALRGLVQSLGAHPEIWQQYVRFDAEQRQWARLPSPSGVDVWLLTWLPSQGTELHDHGGSSAAFTVVQGALTEVRADAAGRLSETTLTRGEVRWVPPDAVHDVANRGVEPAVSVHAYGPRLTHMTFWEVADGALRLVRTVATAEPERAR